MTKNRMSTTRAGRMLRNHALALVLAGGLAGCSTLSGDPVRDLPETTQRIRKDFEACVKDMRTVDTADRLLRIERRYTEAGLRLESALASYAARNEKAGSLDDAASRAVDADVQAITRLGGWLQAQRALFEDTSRPGWRGAVSPKAGSAAAALQGMMAKVLNNGDREALLAGIDWAGVFEHTPGRILAGYRIDSATGMKAFCQQLLQSPGDALQRPVLDLLEQNGLAHPEETARVRAAYARLGAAVKQDLDEGLAGWQDVNYVFGAERSTSQLAIVPLLTVEGRESARRDVRLIKAGNRWVLIAEWLPPLLADVLENAFAREEAKETRAAVLVLTEAARK